MRWGLLGVRLLMITMNLAILIIILFSILPLVQGDISVNIPESNSAHTFSNGVLTIKQPVEINNGGFYNIQELSVSLLMTDGKMVVAEEQTIPQDIPAGRTTTFYVQFNVDTNLLSDEAKRSLVFNSTNLNVSIGIHARYTLGLVKLDIKGNQTMLNEPMISDIHLDPNAITLTNNGTTANVLIPYSFSAGSLIKGQPLSVHANISNATSPMGNGTQNMVISENNQGQVIITLDQAAALWLKTHPEELDIAITFDFYGATLTNDYHYSWNPEGA